MNSIYPLVLKGIVTQTSPDIMTNKWVYAKHKYGFWTLYCMIQSEHRPTHSSTPWIAVTRAPLCTVLSVLYVGWFLPPPLASLQSCSSPLGSSASFQGSSHVNSYSMYWDQLHNACVWATWLLTSSHRTLVIRLTLHSSLYKQKNGSMFSSSNIKYKARLQLFLKIHEPVNWMWTSEGRPASHRFVMSNNKKKDIWRR